MWSKLNLLTNAIQASALGISLWRCVENSLKMREIKFRGLRTDGGGWVEGDLIQPNNIFNTLSGMVKVHPETVGQFTGLKDKNGKDVFEGNLIILGSNVNHNHFTYEVIHQVCDFVLKRSDLYFVWGRLSRLLELNWDYEIIGNIHEKTETK